MPKGFDIWRGLLDVSAYDYYNFVMNVDGRLKTWGDPDFARKLVEFAEIEVIPDPGGLEGVLAKLSDVFGPAPYSYWGESNPREYSPDVTGRITERLVRKEGKSKKPFFIWWTPAAPHREDVAVTLMGRPGPDPRPAPRYAERSSQLAAAQDRELQRGRRERQAVERARPCGPDGRRDDRPARGRLPGAHRLAARGRRSRGRARSDTAPHRASCATR